MGDYRESLDRDWQEFCRTTGGRYGKREKAIYAIGYSAGRLNGITWANEQLKAARLGDRNNGNNRITGND